MNYTQDQLQAIQTIDKNLQIIACAGSGKTEVISARIVNILKSLAQEGIKPENIVAFTFTVKAAAELKNRIYRLCMEQLNTDKGLGDMYIGTIHGFCLNVLQEPPLYRFLKYNVLTEVHQRLFIDRYSTQSGLTSTPLLRGGNLRRWLDSRLYQQLLSIRSEAELAEDQIPTEVDAALRQYRNLADEYCYLDYTTILTEALNALHTHEELRTKIRDRLKYLIVDEYQDVNPLQEQIIRELFELCGNICVVGDDDQTIYQWRGSDVNNIITFTDRYPNVETVPLNLNFRSSQSVVETSRQIIERLPTRLPKAMESSNVQPTNRGDILSLEFTNPNEEAEWVSTKIQQLYGTRYRDKPDQKNTRGLTYSDMSVLLRSVRNDARPIMQALDRAGIPYIVGGMDGLFDTPEIQCIVAVFAYLADFIPNGIVPLTEDNIQNVLALAALVSTKIRSRPVSHSLMNAKTELAPRWTPNYTCSVYI